MAPCRKIPFLSFVVSPYRKVKINLSGCNFNCKGCFAIAKEEKGRSFSVEELMELLIKSCKFIYGEMASDVQMTGGEPTMNMHYLFSLIDKLREKGVGRIGLSTNGYLVDRDFVEGFKSLDVDYIKLDVKAYTDKIHRWYTGRSNVNVLKAVRLLIEYGLNFYVRTIYIPDVIDSDEIMKISKFLGGIDRGITYKIYQFAPEQLDNNISRAATQEEVSKASYIAKEYLDNVEFYTTETAYKPASYRCVEVREDGLLENFQKIDRISGAIIKDWNMQYYTMNQVLDS